MVKIRDARPASYCSIQITTYFIDKASEARRLGFGTGFFQKFNGHYYLITNWHVVTGRNPENPGKTLDGYPCSPTHFQIHLAKKSNKTHFIPLDFVNLYSDRGPNWLESPLGYSSVDLVAIPFDPPEGAFIYTFDQFAPIKETALEPGSNVCIVGFPFDASEASPFPIWKNAIVASEPRYTIGGRLYTYLDTPGRAGMSGSPVYLADYGVSIPNEHVKAFKSNDLDEKLDAIGKMGPNWMNDRTVVLEFAGVYSGSYGDAILDRLNLGRFWPEYHLKSINLDGIKGSNPYI